MLFSCDFTTPGPSPPPLGEVTLAGGVFLSHPNRVPVCLLFHRTQYANCPGRSPSLVAEGVNGIQIRRLYRGQQAEQDADGHGEHHRQKDERHADGHRGLR